MAHRTTQILVLCITVGTPAFASARYVELQTFDSSASATTAGWSGHDNSLNGNSFGFQSTNFTGLSPAGEAGGTIARTSNLAYYADLTLGATPTLGQGLQSSGELAVTSFAFNNAIRIGYFDANASSGSIAFAGFQVAEPQSGSLLRILASIHLEDGSFLESGTPVLISANTNYTWTANWNPSTLVEQVEFFNSVGTSLGTSTVQINSLNVAQSGPFNAFGILTGGIGGAAPTNVANVYIDNLSYAITPVPEPGSLFLCALASGVVGWTVKRRESQTALGSE